MSQPANVPPALASVSSSLEQHAAELAGGHGLLRRAQVQGAPLIDLAEVSRSVEHAAAVFRQPRLDDPVFQKAAEWFLNNHYLLVRTIRQVKTDLPSDFRRRLPHVENDVFPRVFRLATALIEKTQLDFDEATLLGFVQAYQRRAPLTIAELWAVPTMLRISVLRALLRLLGALLPAAGEAAAAWDASMDAGVGMGRVVRALRQLTEIDWKTFFQATSVVEAGLCSDPSSVYSLMDFETRDTYRKVVEALAWGAQRSEPEVVSLALSMASAEPSHTRAGHVGYYLVDRGRALLEKRIGYRADSGERLQRALRAKPTLTYLGAIAVSTLLLGAALVAWAQTRVATPGLCLLGAVALVPLSSLGVAFTNWAVMKLVPPRTLPKLDFSEQIPHDCKTAVVIPALVSCPADVDVLSKQLELHYLSNPDPSLVFVLLTDHVDSPRAPDDQALLRHAEQALDALNQKHGAGERRPFHLLHRDAVWNEAEGHFMGWERKRGKLEEFNRLLRGDRSTSFGHHLGSADGLEGVRFVITLDADTHLPLGAAHRLVGLLAHPLNQAEFEPRTGRVLSGYTVVQPRVEPSPITETTSWFSRIFMGDTALDIYTHAVSDVYQDLFGSGVYVGKGIYDVDAFVRSVGQVPENSLASHDLFEGIHGRAGLATDIVLFEQYPHHYLGFMRRLHRWVRGDWQLLPWLLPRRRSWRSSQGGLRLIDRWKIADNLRRSLLAPALLCLIVLGWMFYPAHAGAWSLLVLSVPLFLSLPALSGERPGQALARWLFGAIMLPYESVVVADAIVRVLVRLTITRKHLLQWVTAAHTATQLAQRSARRVFFREMRAASLLTIGLFAALALRQPAALPRLAPLFVVWLVAPELARRASVTRRVGKGFDAADRRKLRQLARRTWLFFETFVGPSDQWLVPDNFQQEPGARIAHRTSPTNIGLQLTAQLSARDFGYIGPTELSALLHHSLASLERLERYRGHWLNWYDTKTGDPLLPRYVSTVDSGNLAAAFIALAKGCREQADAPVLGAPRWEGLCDALDLLETAVQLLVTLHPQLSRCITQVRGTLERGKDPDGDIEGTLRSLTDSELPELERALLEALEGSKEQHDVAVFREARTWLDRLQHQLRGLRGDVEAFFGWLPLMKEAQTWGFELDIDPELAGKSSLRQASETCAKLRARLSSERAVGAGASYAGWLERTEVTLESAAARADATVAELLAVAGRAEAAWTSMDFGFLFDRRRKLLRIGYNATSDQLDPHFYDLLASEARLASFLSVVLKQVPPTHWHALGRPVTQTHGAVLLRSWGGSMFEYLLPTVFMRSAEATLLSQSERLAVLAHIDYGKSTRTPWGMSESGFAELDAQGNYQYRSFGVPALALRRGAEDDLVMAPYACVLALRLQPKEVLKNLAALEQLGALGTYGLFEAVDYHPIRAEEALRVPFRAPRALSIVRSHMAHHQGMILAALNNALNENVLVERFHADPRIKSGELLLSERLPSAGVAETLIRPPREAPEARLPPATRFPAWSPERDPTVAEVALLSNGRLTTLISDSGAGWTQWKGLALNGGAPDPTCDNDGFWIYVRDARSGRVWSTTPAPMRRRGPDDHVAFQPHKAEFHHRQEGISLRTEIAVAPLDDVEIRYLTLHNESSEPRTLTLASCAVPILEAPSSALRHPAFSRMFVECEALPPHGVVASRRKKSPEEAGVVLVQQAVWDSDAVTWLGCQLDRSTFVGRLHDARNPSLTLENASDVDPGQPARIDPVMVLALQVELAPSATIKIAYVTAAGKTRSAALALARRFNSLHAAKWAIRDAAAGSARRLEHAGMTPALLPHAMRLVSRLLLPEPAFRAPRQTLLATNPSKRQLWGHGVSGDDPLLVVQVADADKNTLVTDVLTTYRYLRGCRVPLELIFVDHAASSYQADALGGIHRALARTGTNSWLRQRGGIFVLASDQLRGEVRSRLEACARVFLDAERGALHEQWPAHPPSPAPLPLFPKTHAEEHIPASPQIEPSLTLANGYGGFSEDGREYVIRLPRGHATPAPWCNVLSNPQFGCLVSASSLGATWSGNSGENRLTPWRNDPVGDAPSEALYLRDEETGRVWSPTPLPAGSDAPTSVRHGAGYTVYEQHSHGLRQTLTVFVPPDAPLKILRLSLHNDLEQPRRLTATYYVEWVLGAFREEQAPHVRSELASAEHCILAKCAWSADNPERVAFVSASRSLHGFTCDRREFLGRSGSMREPEALARWGLAGSVEPGTDPCAALQAHLELGPGESLELHFILGEESDRGKALELVRHFRDPSAVEAAWVALRRYWDGVLGAVQVKTPEPEIDLMLNRWLLYQSLSSRFFARSAFYQSSGAFGFRDQLQDVMAFTLADASLARAHLLEAASHQFEEGDVLHWWHPPVGRGVRTRCSDDLLWLPFVVAHYVSATGDTAILAEQIPFLRAPELEAKEHDRYAEFPRTQYGADLLEHCRRALTRGFTQGPRGLPFIGDGDWNDGMNRVGSHGTGESVWLAWFTFATARRFAELLARIGCADEGERWLERAATLKAAVERTAWDGAWYVRAFYDDGSPLGSSTSASCQIDSIAQSWAAISGAADSARALTALRSANERLVRADERLVLLLDPPFRGARHDPGYIAAYPAGVRENGGQYTHAAAWLGWAHAAVGDGDGAANVLRLLNPASRTKTSAGVERYRVEPYVLAADVYSVPPFVGRGGWTWYTGAAAWTWRLGVEAILGIYPDNGGLRFDPCIPSDWPAFEATIRVAKCEVHVTVENPDHVSRGIRELSLDGVTLAAPLVHFAGAAGQKYEVHIVLGSTRTRAAQAPRASDARAPLATDSVASDS